MMDKIKAAINGEKKAEKKNEPAKILVDNTAFIEKEIKPLMNELFDKADKAKVPLFMVVQMANKEEGSQFASSATASVSAGAADVFMEMVHDAKNTLHGKVLSREKIKQYGAMTLIGTMLALATVNPKDDDSKKACARIAEGLELLTDMLKMV